MKELSSEKGEKKRIWMENSIKVLVLAVTVLLLGSFAGRGRMTGDERDSGERENTGRENAGRGDGDTESAEREGTRTEGAGREDTEREGTERDSAERDNAGEKDTCSSGDPLLSGTIEIVGSSSMERMANALAESFMDKHPEVTVTVQFTGSSAGIAAVAAGSADIGNSSRYIESGEAEWGVVENIVALDGIALCVDSGNTLTGLTQEQAIDIFTGRITNWESLTGINLPIVTVGREAGSGTRSAFEGQFGIIGQCTYANEVDSTGAVMARVASTPGAIGYVSTDLFLSENAEDSIGLLRESGKIRNRLKLLSLDGVEPNVQNIESEAYPLYRPFVMATRGKIHDQNRLVREWFAYVYGEEGRNIIRKTGLIVPE